MKAHLLKFSAICFAIFVFTSGINFVQAQSEEGGEAAPTVIEPSDSGSADSDPEPRPEPQANKEPEPVYTQNKAWWKNIYVDVMFGVDVPFNMNRTDAGFTFIFLRPGYKFIDFGNNMGLGAEMELGMTWYDVDGLDFGDVSQFTMLFGVRFFYEVIQNLSIEPSLGIGLHRFESCVSFGVGRACGSSTDFAMKLGSNVMYQVTDFIAVGGGLKFATNDFDIWGLVIEFGASYRW